MADRYYGVSKGSKSFPFIEIVIDPSALNQTTAQAEYDRLFERRTKIIRTIARSIREAGLQPGDDIPATVVDMRHTVLNIDVRIVYLIELFPEVQR